MATTNLGDPTERDKNVDFTVDVGGQAAFCTITREALDDHFDVEGNGSRVRAYIANVERIQEVARTAASMAMRADSPPTKTRRIVLQSKHF